MIDAAPTPEEIRAARKAAGLTQEHAARLVHSTGRAWRMWEAGDRTPDPAKWELFRFKTGTQTETTMTDAISQIQDEQTRAFAEACYNMNSIDELEDATLPDEADMKTWGIDRHQWLAAIEAALLDKRADAGQ